MQVTLFGGSGFLGRYILRRLLARGLAVRVASRRRPLRPLSPDGKGDVEWLQADVRDEATVAAALAGADATVNAVALYVERGRETFRAVHVEGAGRVARLAAAAGIKRLVHVSGIGADSESRSAYVRARAAGEAAVEAAFAGATILRPSVIFAPDDSFLNTLIGLVSRLPLVPLFGDGGTRLQPVFAGDVAEAAVEALVRPARSAGTYELGGPEIFTYRALVELLAARVARRPLLLPLPFAAWNLLAAGASLLPSAPLTLDQVTLLRDDKVADSARPGLAALGVEPTAIAEILPQLLARRRACARADPGAQR
ncbi:MAG: complex I NDUFA9 subunit family protein [Kiloniellales bacterium]